MNFGLGRENYREFDLAHNMDASKSPPAPESVKLMSRNISKKNNRHMISMSLDKMTSIHLIQNFIYTREYENKFTN